MGGDSNCGFWVVSCLLGNREEYYNIVWDTLITELKEHKELYICVLGSKEKVEEIYNTLVPAEVGFTPENKWMCFPEMCYLIASANDMVCINLTRYGYSETYFPLCTAPTPNPSDRIMCWVDFKSMTFYSSLFEIGMPYTTDIIRVGASFHRAIWDMAGRIHGKDARIQQFEPNRNRKK